PDGGSAAFPVTWIGRYVLDGTAIADEMQAPAPDGSPWLGMSLRQFDAARQTWIIEFLNVTGAFLRRQVNGNAGSVSLDGRNVTVASASPGMNIREHYLVTGNDAFTYRLDISTDEGRNWTEGQMEISLKRAGRPDRGIALHD